MNLNSVLCSQDIQGHAKVVRTGLTLEIVNFKW